MEKTRKNNYVITLLSIILIIPFLSIAGIKNNLTLDLYQSWQTLAMIVFLTLLIVKSGTIQMNWAVCLFGIYQAIIAFSSVFNNGFSPGMIIVIITSVLVFALLQTDCYYEMLSAICVVVVGSMLANFPMVLTRMNEENAMFFIGGKNSLGIFLIPGVFLLMINSLEQHGKLTKPVICAIALSLLSIFLGASGTGIIVVLCALLFWFLSTRSNPKKWLYLGILTTMYLLFLVFSESFFLTDVWLNLTDMLGKDSTLTSRTEIWEATKYIVEENFFFGAGRGAEIGYVNSLGKWKIMYEAHNFILEILLEGGFCALVVYVILFVKAVNPLNMDLEKHRIVFIALFILLINGLTESINNSYLVTATLGVACKFATEQNSERRKEQLARQKKEARERQNYELRRVRKV